MDLGASQRSDDMSNRHTDEESVQQYVQDAEENSAGVFEVDHVAGTAHDLKALHAKLSELPDTVLERIPVLEEGSPLRQGATYVDLNASARGEFTASGNMVAIPGSALVPKAAVDYEAWNLLLERLETHS
jgi:hypothetical protein